MNGIHCSVMCRLIEAEVTPTGVNFLPIFLLVFFGVSLALSIIVFVAREHQRDAD